MTVNVNLNRPKATQEVTVPIVIGEVAPQFSGSGWTQYLTLNDIQAPSFERTGAIVEDAAEVVLTSGHNVRVGDVVTGTGIPAATSVSAVDATTITLSNAATATNPTATLTFTPQEVDARFVGIVGDISVSGTNVRVRIRLHRATGNTVGGADDTTTIAEMGAHIGEVVATINLDQYLSNMRFPRVNS